MAIRFFALNVRILKGAGIYPPQTTNKFQRRAIWVFNAACVCYSMVYFTIAELAALPSSAAHIGELVKNLNMSMSFILTLCKISVWFYHHAAIVRIMRTLESSAMHFTPVPGIFHPAAIIAADKRLKDRLTYTFFTLSCLVPTSACVVTLISARGEDMSGLKLPYHSFVPFDYRASTARYCAAVVYQCLALLSCGMITVGFDMLFYSLVCFTSTHLRLLQGAFATIKEKVLLSPRAITAAGPEVLQACMYAELRACIRHLQLILGFCEELEQIFSLLILAQILVSLVVFCTCLYIVSSIPTGIGNEIAYMLAIENQLALYCYAGNKLTTRAAAIPNAIYSSDWITTTSKSYRMNVIFTMMRMTKPIYLTAGKFTAMTLATFVTIGRGSYSLLAMLKNSNK